MLGDAAVVEAWAAAPVGAPSTRLAPLLDVLAGGAGPRPLALEEALLQRVLAATGGAALDGAVTCPACGERLDVALELAEPPEGTAPAAVSAAGRTVRLPTAEDVAAAVATVGVRAAGRDALPAAARALLERLLVDGNPGTLDEDETAELDAALAAAAPASPSPVQLTCPACGHLWHALVDLAAFAWDRVDRRARRLLGQVHRLASAYGWTHDHVLGLPDQVRQRYLELVP